MSSLNVSGRIAEFEIREGDPQILRTAFLILLSLPLTVIGSLIGDTDIFILGVDIPETTIGVIGPFAALALFGYALLRNNGRFGKLVFGENMTPRGEDGITSDYNSPLSLRIKKWL